MLTDMLLTVAKVQRAEKIVCALVIMVAAITFNLYPFTVAVNTKI